MLSQQRLIANKHITICAFTFSSCNIGTSALPDMYTQVPRASAYISGNALVPMLQLLCNTSSTLKSAKTCQEVQLSSDVQGPCATSHM